MTGTSAPAFPARGRIGEHHLASVLLALLHEGCDGCLTVTRGRVTRRLYLRGGMIVYSSSTKRADRLGEILVAQPRMLAQQPDEFDIDSVQLDFHGQSPNIRRIAVRAALRSLL